MNDIIKTVIEKIHTHELKLDICDLNSGMLERFGRIREAGASPTVMAFTNLLYGTVSNSIQKIPVAAKIFLDVRDDFKHQNRDDVEGLIYESKIYGIVNDIIINNHSPNFIGSFGTALCDYSSIINSLSKNMKKQMINRLEDLYNIDRNYLSEYKMGIILNPAIRKPVFIDYFINGASSGEKMKILFQIVFSLAVMKKYGLMHNDFHIHNVLFSQTEPVRDYIFVAEDKIYRIYTNHIPYIMDWDAGYSELYGSNSRLVEDESHMCLYRGLCNFYREKNDLAVFLCYLGDNNPSRELRNMYYSQYDHVRDYISREIMYPQSDVMNYLRKQKKVGEDMYKVSYENACKLFGKTFLDDYFFSRRNIICKDLGTYIDIFHDVNSIKKFYPPPEGTFHDKIRKIRPAHGNVYKLSRAQLIELIGKTLTDTYFPQIISAFVEIHSDKMKIISPHDYMCRIPTYKEGSLTPTEIITKSNIFDIFRISDIPSGFPENNIFRLPTRPKYPRRIARDPRVPSTRDKIEGVPRFDPRTGAGFVKSVRPKRYDMPIIEKKNNAEMIVDEAKSGDVITTFGELFNITKYVKEERDIWSSNREKKITSEQLKEKLIRVKRGYTFVKKNAEDYKYRIIYGSGLYEYVLSSKILKYNRDLEKYIKLNKSVYDDIRNKLKGGKNTVYIWEPGYPVRQILLLTIRGGGDNIVKLQKTEQSTEYINASIDFALYIMIQARSPEKLVPAIL